MIRGTRQTLRFALALTLLAAAIGKTVGVIEGEWPPMLHTLATVMEVGLGFWLLKSRNAQGPVWGALGLMLAGAVHAVFLVQQGAPVTSLCGCFGPHIHLELLHELALTGGLLAAIGTMLVLGGIGDAREELTS